MSYSSNPFPPHAASQVGKQAQVLVNPAPVGLTLNGCVLFVVGLLVFASAFLRMRMEVGGLGVHLYLLVLGVPAIYVLTTRIGEFPFGALASLSIFTFLYCIATLAGPLALQEIAKVVASAATVVTIALLVRSEGDFRLGSLGLLFAVTALAILGLVNKHESFNGVDPIQGSNENAFSLYTLAPMLLAGYIALDQRVALWFRTILLACIMVLVLAMFSNANRSGWLCIGLIALMLLWRGQSLRATVFVAIMSLVAYFVVIKFGDLDLISFRAKETLHNKSDTYREELFIGCMKIGLANPFMGVSPQLVPKYLAPYVGEQKYVPDPHNVFGAIWAGTGMITSAALAWFAWCLWSKPPLLASMKQAVKRDGRLKEELLSPHRLMQMMLILWIVRGMFSREILYAPAFCMGIGLVIGLSIVHGMWTVSPIRRATPPLIQPTAVR